MESVALCGAGLSWPVCDDVGDVEVAGANLRFGLVHAEDTAFSAGRPDDAEKVLVRTDAFSCNYRDTALLKLLSSALGDRRYSYFGSEFVGEVVDVGSSVTSLAVGDRVIPNGAYPESGVPGLRGGIPTNHGSRRLQVHHPGRLAKIPSTMPDDVAASFTIGAQTSYGMIDRLNLADGEKVLITAGRSNTSLFAMQALRDRPVEITVLTTSASEAPWPDHVDVVRVSPGVPLAECDVLRRAGPFDCVVDPLFDVYLGQVSPLLAMGGRYITCGLYHQTGDLAPPAFGPGRLEHVLTTAILKNHQIMGNCLGSAAHLERAIEDYSCGDLDVIVDQRFTGADAAAFVNRTYNDRTRFGKVVYQYADRSAEREG